MGICKMIVNFD